MLYLTKDIAGVIGYDRQHIINWLNRGYAPLRDGDKRPGQDGPSWRLSEPTARLVTLAGAAISAGLSPKIAFVAAECFLAEAPRNQFEVDGAGRASRVRGAGRAPGRPFLSGATWFACRADGRACIINAVEAAHLSIPAVSECLGGDRRPGFLLVDIDALDSGFEAMKERVEREWAS